MTGNEVFQNRQAFAEVRLYRTVNDTTGRIRHQSAHAGQLFNLVNAAAGAGIRHHGNWIKFICSICIFQQFSHIIRSLIPDINYFFVAFVISHQAAAIHSFRPVNQFFGSLDDLVFALRHMDIGNRNGNTGLAGIVVPHLLDDIQHVGRTQITIHLVGFGNQFAQFLFGDELTKMPVLFTGLFVFLFAEEA